MDFKQQLLKTLLNYVLQPEQINLQMQQDGKSGGKAIMIWARTSLELWVRIKCCLQLLSRAP